MTYNYISSRTNPLVVMLCSLQTTKGRELNGLYLCEGLKLCKEALPYCKIKYAIIKESKQTAKICSVAEHSEAETLVLSDSAYDKISSDSASDGIIFAVEINSLKEEISSDDRVLMLEDVRDPGNVGTIIRSAAAFGIDTVILCGCADIYNPKTIRSSMGAAFKVKTLVSKSKNEIFSILKEQKRRIIVTALNEKSKSLGEFELYRSDCIIIGNEGHGVSKETLENADETVIIPMTNKTESLNAATAASVMLWEYSKVR